MVTIKEIVFICSTILNDANTENPVKHQVYNENTQKIEVVLTQQENRDQILNGCILVGQKALDMKVDPILAIAVAYHESQFRKDIIGGGSIGMMQVIPKYWCRLDTEVEDWYSPSQFLWLPIKPRPDKCKKKRLKPNHYFNEICKQFICDIGNCIKKNCDLERAGMLALLEVKNKNLKEMLFRYNKGNQCDKITDTDKKDKCIKSGYKYADSVLGLYNRYKKKLKTAKL